MGRKSVCVWGGNTKYMAPFPLDLDTFIGHLMYPVQLLESKVSCFSDAFLISI